MSSDNFYVVHENKVWMGFWSDLLYATEKAERKWYRKLLGRSPIHVADSHEAAKRWAWEEYSEYGVWALPKGTIKEEATK